MDREKNSDYKVIQIVTHCITKAPHSKSLLYDVDIIHKSKKAIKKVTSREIK